METFGYHGAFFSLDCFIDMKNVINSVIVTKLLSSKTVKVKVDDITDAHKQ